MVVGSVARSAPASISTIARMPCERLEPLETANALDNANERLPLYQQPNQDHNWAGNRRVAARITPDGTPIDAKKASQIALGKPKHLDSISEFFAGHWSVSRDSR